MKKKKLELFWIGNNIVKKLGENLSIYKFLKDYLDDVHIGYPFENRISENALDSFINDFLELASNGNRATLKLNNLTTNSNTLSDIEKFKDEYRDFISNIEKIRNSICKHKTAYIKISKLNDFSPFDLIIAEKSLLSLFTLFNKILEDNKEKPFVFNYPDSLIFSEMNEKFSDRTSRFNKIKIY